MACPTSSLFYAGWDDDGEAIAQEDDRRISLGYMCVLGEMLTDFSGAAVSGLDLLLGQ
jgi:hypothetical protein